MLKRTLIGASVLAVTLTAWWVDSSRPGQPAWAMAALGVVLVLGALFELLRMAGAGPAVRVVTLAFGVVWVALGSLNGLPEGVLPPSLDGLRTSPYPGPMHAASILCGLLLAARLRHAGGPGTATVARNPLFALAWVGGLTALIHALLAGRLEFVLGVVLTTKSSDIGGYFVGKTVGGRKLAPSISPGKTWAGAVGGVALPALVAVFLLSGVDVTLPVHGGQSVALPGSPLLAALLGAGLGVIAIVSDLCESLVKRALGCKDSGTLFGESGGFLDLADSLLLVAPVALAYTAVLS